MIYKNIKRLTAKSRHMIKIGTFSFQRPQISRNTALIPINFEQSASFRQSATIKRALNQVEIKIRDLSKYTHQYTWQNRSNNKRLPIQPNYRIIGSFRLF